MTDAVAVTSRRREATRQKLLDAAAQVFAEVGMDAASVEAVCDRAGFTRGAFYSNFDSKEELFLELAGHVAQSRVAAVRARVADLEDAGDLTAVTDNVLGILGQVLDVTNEDRLGVLLMSEIRIHALRSPDLARAYLAQEEEMLGGVAQIIDDIAATRGLAFRLSSRDTARLMLSIWESESVRSVMAGVEYVEMCRRTNEQLARIAQLIIDPSPH